MCGIAGIIRWNNARASPAEIERMTRCLSHRGPDGEGIFRRDCVSLGHRRLAIIDIECGIQPMPNEDESIWITFNGEIYNFKELKTELEGKGHIFRTHSDTEVIVHAYEEWDAECIKKFKGMFAFGLVDFNKRIFFLARDHFGIKPLLYCLDNNFFAFASELSSFRQIDGYIPKGKLLSIDFFLRHQYIPAPYTVFDNIFKLLPAHYMTVSFDGKISGPHNYYPMEFDPGDKIPEGTWYNQLDDQISGSIESHLISDVPVGLFLSGGIDSTIIALNMKKKSNAPIRAFSIGFEDSEYNETGFAREAADRLGIELHEEIITENAIELLPGLIEKFGEPFGDSSAIPTFFVSQLAKKHVSVVLSGDGGDEFFAGYETLLGWIHEISFRDVIKEIFRSPLQFKCNLIKYIKKTARRRSLDLTEEWLEYYTYMKARQRKKLWKSRYHYLLNQPCETFARESNESKTRDRTLYAQYMLLKTYLPYDILTKVDISSMAHGLEVRPPFIDTNIFSFASKLPVNCKINLNKDICKYILKKYLEPSFPTDFIYRKKKGFAVPLDTWFEPGHKAREMLEDILRNKDSRLHEWFKESAINNALSQHDRKQSDSGMLWTLLVLGIWLDQNKEIEFIE